MLIGYGHTSTAEQNPDHQGDALLRHGVERGNIHVDVASGAKASRPKLDLVRAVRQGKNACCHAVGTCVMGGEGTPTAVVDHMGKVHGVDGLYVVDASIMPDIPAEPTNTTVTMTVERCADKLGRNARPSTALTPPARPAAEPWRPAVPYAVSCRTGRTRVRSYAPDARPPPCAGAVGERRTGAP